ncbi:hypothetical protein FRC04_011075 [Tulasnella sp. 424]|nr:hypothetical protein FRC04_011075 [Tulasnella sp. 424]KAG8978392.1 hypothetical protein FRC05_010637 [Tulasnella sp. 425]
MPKARQQTLEEAFNLSPARRKISSASSPLKRGSKSTQYQSSPVRSKRVRSPTPDSDSDDAATDSGSDVREIPFESTPSRDNTSNDDDESDGESQVLRPSTQRTPRRLKQRRAPPTPPSSDSESPLSEDMEEDDDDEPVLASASKNRKRRLVDSDDEPPTKRKLVRGKGRPSSDEDEDLMDEVQTELILEPRLRGPSKKSKFSANLDRMKRRRKGERQPTPEPEVVDVSDSESEPEAGPSSPTAPFRGAKPPGEDLSDVEDENAELDDDFIEHDSDNDVAVELPVAFSRHSHQDLSLSFKAICQLYVHLAIQPPQSRARFMKEAENNEYFKNALRALSKKLDGLRDSLVRSSVWKPEFTKVLNTYPEFELMNLDFSVPTCDACHMGGRVSTFMGRSSGRPYRKDTFEPKGDVGSDDDDSEDDSDSDSEDSDEIDKDDYKVFEFNLGRFCAARAKAYFKFIHWQYLLYSGLKSEVDLLRGEHEKRGKKKGQAFFRGSWGVKVKLPDNKDDGDQVMAWLDERGIIQAEWIKIKKLMENAHHLEASRNANDNDIGLG